MKSIRGRLDKPTAYEIVEQAVYISWSRRKLSELTQFQER